MPDTNIFTLVDSGPSPTTVTLSPLMAYNPIRSIANGQVVNIGLFGAVYADTPYSKQSHELTVNNVSNANAVTLNSWCALKTVLTYTPDTGTPGTTYQVMIMNDSSPMARMINSPTAIFEGTLSLRQV